MDYNSSRWRKTRKRILSLDGYKDRVAAMYGRNEEAVIVHHIYPAEEYPQWQYATWNLISVSLATHNKLENRRTGELTEFGKQLQIMIPPFSEWRKANGQRRTII